MPKIVTIGGGTGAPVIIQSLLQAGFTNLSCICASMDSGGKTGIIRSDERDHVIAISDILRNLIALIPTKDQDKNVAAFVDMISFVDGRQRNLGYTIYYALLEKYNNFLKVQNHFEDLLELKFHGIAIPVTTTSSNLCFETKNGSSFCGEHELDKQSMSTNTITNLWLEPEATATPEAIQSLQEADYIIYCPGSLYGSVLANCLPLGISEALEQTKAQKILVTNLVSNRNQTHGFTPTKYLNIFQKYTKISKPIDIIICPDTSQEQFENTYPQIKEAYESEHSHFLGWNQQEIAEVSDKDIKVLISDIISITPHLNRLRHDPAKLANLFKEILI